MDARILVADDEKTMRETLRAAFEAQGCVVSAASDGAKAMEIMGSGGIDLAVLDIMMPRMDGTEVLRRLRSSGSTLPVIFLSSRDEEIDKVLGLELGADDYLTKPFSLRELLARAKALLRRASPDWNAQGSRFVSLGPLRLDAEGYRAALGERDLGLTLTEFRLLLALAGRPGQALSREQLLRAAYPEDVYLSDRAIDCHIKRLRRKLEAGGEPGGLIETVYGLGYRVSQAAETGGGAR